MPTLSVTAPGADVAIPKSGGRRRILITGGSGFVGQKLAVRLADSGSDILSLGGPGGPRGSDGYLAVDLTDSVATTRCVEDFAPTTIIHLAAQSSVGATANPAQVWRTNFDATRNIANAALALVHPVRLIFASTAEVYGRAFLRGQCNEDTALEPQSSYARSKAACEYFLRDVADDRMSVVVLRLFNHTGPGQDQRFVVPSFAAQLVRLPAAGPAIIQVGNLDAKRDFTDVADILDAYKLVVNHPEKAPHPFEVFNVGSGIQRTIRSILDQLIEHHGEDVDLHVDPARQRPSEIAIAAGDFDRFRTVYDWTPSRLFADTIKAVYDHERLRFLNL